MSNISIVEAKLPPGFRFHPRDEELVCDYLMKKVMMISNHQFLDDHLLMIEVDLNKCEPWDIPETARVGGKEWYFYSRRDRKYATGMRTNRATATGYWKATGKDRPIYRKSTLVGMRKTLVFYQGRAPKGRKSEWVMHEFRLEGLLVPPKISSQEEDWVLGRVFYKNREVAAKPSMEISCHDDDTGSSSLPGLMDSYITFDQTQPNLQYEHEQVPCFSIFSQDQTNNQTFPHMITQHHMEVPDNLSTRNNCSPFGQLPLLTTPNNLDSLSHDNNKVLKAVLTHLTKMGSSHNIEQSPSLGEGSSESYLSEVAMPNAWNLY